MKESDQHIISTVNNGIQKIIFNRPLKKNAITTQMYKTLINLLKESSTNKAVIALVFTGTGKFYCSGNDMTMSINSDQTSDNPLDMVKKFIDALIVYPKLLIAIVNGPAIGIAMTKLGLFDIIYASDTAYFQTPFSKIGFTAEGCSTYTFPAIFGTSKASEILYLNYKLSAEEACKRGFVSKVFRNEDIDQIWFELQKISTLSKESLLGSKKLIKQWRQDKLLRVNEEEIKVLGEVVLSENFAESLMNYLSNKSKM